MNEEITTSAGKNQKRISILSRTAKEVRSYRVTKKILISALVMLTVLLSIMYLVSALYKQSGSFTVSVDKYEMIKYGLTLSESRDMSYNTSVLNAKINEDIINITESDIPENVDMIDGAHNGENYIAYTFYIQNAGTVELAFEYTLVMTGITQDLDSALRVKVYENGTPTVYAKTATDGSGPELGTREFYSSNVVARERIDAVAPGDINKFTVVVWIEGTDPDCIDWLIGGKLKLEMIMSVVH
jgi:hypothetical protein